MTSTLTIAFDEPGSTDPALVGGKSANLARLTAAGFPVPAGFTVTTTAYDRFAEANGIAAAIRSAPEGGGVAQTDARATAVRAAVAAGAVPPAIADAVVSAYAALGKDTRVAVRSSGTAEDLAEASFAGQHDTFLDVCGPEAVLDALRRCWMSLWTDRAVAYRARHGFDESAIGIAVAVQRMVEADVAGVMFTANPVSTATNEIVVNANWGLGESLVSGQVSPDEYVLCSRTRQPRRQVIGAKELRIDRDPDAASGTRTRPTTEAERASACLSDAQLAELAGLGLAVAECYDGLPTDIEWALHDGAFALVQARPITGVEFTWDDDLEAFQTRHEDADTVYTRAWSDDFSIAAITPLYYTTRTKEQSDCYLTAQKLYGHEDAAELRAVKYHKGEQYFCSNMEAAAISRILPKALRNAGSMSKIPPSWWDRVANEPFSWADHLKMHARIMLLDGRSGPYRYDRSIRERMDDGETGHGLNDAALQRLTDRALCTYIDDRLDIWKATDDDQWSAFFVYTPLAMGTIVNLLVAHYDGDVGEAFADLMSGLPEPSITMIENHEIWQFGERIKASPALRGLLDEHRGQAFFDALGEHPEGREFLADYLPWRTRRGHRGAADRDFILPRRLDDPMIDYSAFAAMMAGDGSDPLIKEAEHRAKRARRENEVVAAIRRAPLGSLKAEVFRVLQSWCLRFLAHRDDQREYLDLLAYTQRRAFLELGRRLRDAGHTDERDDVFFLGLPEAYALLEGRANVTLTRAKIAGRKRAFVSRQRMEVTLPNYIGRDGVPVLPGELIGAVHAAELDGADGSTVLPGVGTSAGSITGRARVLKDMADIVTLERGDILVCHATDPGWTPAFFIIGGLVMQTGGVLAHGSCLSREYNLPAAVVPEAVRRIPDGAWITLNGSAGTVTIAKPEPQPGVTSRCGQPVWPAGVTSRCGQPV
ncbi:MAG TPA: PEP/pyruvate-binding domain-containing protein [Pseudonocardia sp.]|nr:PEP/pyruvate-binding domain-containing protein [Pseudonocardia sp.]